MICAAVPERLHGAVTPFGLPITDVQMVMPILCLHIGYRDLARYDQDATAYFTILEPV
jgi:hypothetical protein